ncbi:MAG: glycosyltransferase family 39 protein [Halochromatium sp.]
MSLFKPKWRGGSSVSMTVLFMLAVIIAVGVFLRAQAFLGTEVTEPLQAKAAESYALAQTLSDQGAYQVLAAPFDASGEDAAAGEVFGSLGYPLFLSLFASPEATPRSLDAAVIAQLVLGTLAILLVFMLTTRLMDPHWGLIVAFLTAVSPFLVNISLFLVGATLLLVTLLFYLMSATRLGERGALIRTLVAAALLGVVALVDPTYQLLILPWLLMLVLSVRKGASKVLIPIAAVLGFALVFGPWVARNQILVDAPIATTPIAASIQQGMPTAASDNAEAETPRLLASIGRLGGAMIRDPGWYFVEKPQTLWSFGQPADPDDSDAESSAVPSAVPSAEQSLVYPVSRTPYAENPIFLTSEEFMRLLHAPVLLIGALGAILVWLPFAGRRLTPSQRIGLRSISLVLIYATLVHVFGVAAPQYATPLLPLLFLMALTPLYILTAPRLEAAPPKKNAKTAPETESEEEATETD